MEKIIKFFKCLFGHRWIYSREPIKYVRMYPSIPGATKAVEEFEIISNVRYCANCHKKQSQRSIPMQTGRFDENDWNDYNQYTKQELRDKKIDSII